MVVTPHVECAQHVGRRLDEGHEQRVGNREVEPAVDLGVGLAHHRPEPASGAVRLVHFDPDTVQENGVAMQSRLEEVTLETRGDGDTVDVTEHAQKAIANSGLRDGLCTVFVAHSTCGVTTIEFEPGCNADLARVMEQVAPIDDAWEHNARNADTNGHSHVRAAMIGPSETIPFADGELCVGTWQKIVCIDFDDRPRQRRLLVQLLGV